MNRGQLEPPPYFENTSNLALPAGIAGIFAARRTASYFFVNSQFAVPL
jgi:hypothetical protein